MAGKIALLAGATGATGRELLDQLIASKDYSAIHLVLRRPMAFDLPEKVHQHIGADIVGVAPTVTPDAVFCCLGTTISKAGSREAFRAIDLDLVLSLGQWAKKQGAGSFHVISSINARPNGNFYLRTKAAMEKGLSALGLDQLVIYRPSLLYGGDRPEFRAGEALGLPLLKMIGVVSKRLKPVHVKTLARAMVVEAGSSSEAAVRILESDAIQSFRHSGEGRNP